MASAVGDVCEQRTGKVQLLRLGGCLEDVQGLSEEDRGAKNVDALRKISRPFCSYPYRNTPPMVSE